MKIDLYASSGSPIGLIPADITGRGVGGAELAMMTWAETMAGRGHDIRIYNDPRQPGGYDGVIYLNKSEYAPREARDALIVFRTPMTELRATQAGIKIFWSCDQFTSGDFSRDIFPYVDRAVCISPHHVDYHRTYYHVEDSKIGHIDLGVRLAEYRQDYEKIAGRCIFCSVPDRGLNVLRVIWPQIKERMPGASLVITADYRLWGAANAGNHQHRLEWLSLPDVTFLGTIPREQ